MEKPKKVRLSLDLDEDVKRKFAFACLYEGKKQSQVLTDLVLRFLKTQSKKGAVG